MLERLYDPALLSDRVRGRNDLADPKIMAVVTDIMASVKKDGDKALAQYTRRFDKCDIEDFKVSEEEIEKAYEEIDSRMLSIIRQAIGNIKAYHEKQKPESWSWEKEPGLVLGQKVTPIEIAGVYVPGGTAPLISSVIMNVVPAVVAGVGRIIVCTPPDGKGGIDAMRIAAAVESGADEIYKAGGAQAIFAMAFGTGTIPKVDIITGPGNIYVAYAKKMAYGFCGIDMIAGPSEILIVADSKANPAFVAADLLSQAEHDARASSILVTFEEEFADRVEIELEKQIALLPRRRTAAQSLNDYGAAYIAKDREEALLVVNQIAPEHCELLVEDMDYYTEGIRNAGAIFAGEYSPEPLGDYWAGPNHTLPTGGTAKFYSPLGVYDFCKRTSMIKCSRRALEKDIGKIADFARAEGLEAHAGAIDIRFKKEVD